MSDEAELNTRQAAYIDRVRSLGRRERGVGLFVVLVGIVVLAFARFRLGGEPAALWGGVAIIGAGWVILVWALVSRFLWIRAHPFDPNSSPQG